MTNDKILVIDDNKTFCDYLCNILDAKGFCTKKAYSYRTATELIRNAQAEDVVLCDLQLGDNKTGNDLLKWMNENGFNNPFIIMTQYDQAVTAVEAMKLGAENYIPKELLFDKLYPKIEEIIQHRKLLRKKEGNIHERKSKAFQEVYRRVFLCAPTDLTVFILGANGTGKEHVAHRIQAKSNRANKPYISVDCGTLGKDLAASALFGYKKGAFTGAETELQYHPLLRSEAECGLGLYAKKALSFIRKMMQQVKSGISNMLSVPAATNASSKKKDNITSPIRWTGKASDLVEILYGIDELGCINDGETPLKEIAAYFYKMLGVNAKECYHIYADMKMRKNESRTYFLDKMYIFRYFYNKNSDFLKNVREIFGDMEIKAYLCTIISPLGGKN